MWFWVSLRRAARDRRHQQHLVAVLERIGSAAQEADIFLVHINFRNRRVSPASSRRWGFKSGNCGSSSENSSLRFAAEQDDARRPRSEPPQSGGNLNGDAHQEPPGRKPIENVYDSSVAGDSRSRRRQPRSLQRCLIDRIDLTTYDCRRLPPQPPPAVAPTFAAEIRLELGQLRSDRSFGLILIRQHVGGLQSVASDAEHRRFVRQNAVLLDQLARGSNRYAAAVSVKMPSLSASNWMPLTTSGSETSSDHPPLLVMAFNA